MTNSCTNVYNKFSPVNYSSSREYLSNAYGSTGTKKVEFYNDPKKQRTKKIQKMSFIGVTALIGAALIFKGFTHKSISQESIKLLKKAQNSIQGNTKLNNFSDKTSNLMSNTINVKDDYWKKFEDKTEHTPLFFIKKIGNWITGVYKKALSSTFSKKYKQAVDELIKAGVIKKGDVPDNFDKWFEGTFDAMYKELHKEGQWVTDGLLNKDVFSKMTSSNMADGKIVNILDSQMIDISKATTPEARAAIEQMNKLKGTLLPKMRDMACGSAPTDLLTIIMSTSGLGIAIASEKDKQKRKSTTINLGIPLLTTLTSTTYGAMKALAGSRLLIFGFISGQLASLVAKTVDKKLSKNNSENMNKNV